MRKVFVMFVWLLSVLSVSAKSTPPDSVFRAFIYNEEYQVYMDLDFYNGCVSVPGQDILGRVSGYFGAVRDSRKWLVTEARLIGNNKAFIKITNDYGSEDLTATLVYNHKDKSYTLRQTGGARLKIVVNRKWVKIPIELRLFPHERMESRW